MITHAAFHKASGRGRCDKTGLSLENWPARKHFRLATTRNERPRMEPYRQNQAMVNVAWTCACQQSAPDGKAKRGVDPDGWQLMVGEEDIGLDAKDKSAGVTGEWRRSEICRKFQTGTTGTVQ